MNIRQIAHYNKISVIEHFSKSFTYTEIKEEIIIKDVPIPFVILTFINCIDIS